MNRNFRFVVAGLGIFMIVAIAQAAQVPINVFPDPVQFGTVPLNSPGYVGVFVTNVSASSVVVTGMVISGTNSLDFGFIGPNCTGVIPGG